MINKITFILLLLISQISATADDPAQNPEGNWAQNPPVIYTGLDGHKLDIRLPYGATAFHALELSGDWGKMVENGGVEVLSYNHPLESGKEYRIVKNDCVNPLEFVRDLVARGQIMIESASAEYGQKITCNGLSFLIDENAKIETDEPWLNIRVYNGKNYHFQMGQTCRDILLMIFYAANKKEIMQHELVLRPAIIDLGNILDIAKNDYSDGYASIPFMSHAGICDFCKGFVAFARFCNLITHGQRDHAFEFLATAEKVRRILISQDPDGRIPRKDLEELIMNHTSPDGTRMIEEYERPFVQRLFRK